MGCSPLRMSDLPIISLILLILRHILGQQHQESTAWCVLINSNKAFKCTPTRGGAGAEGS